MHRRLLTISSILFLACWKLANAAVVIQYHHISDDTPSITSVTPDRFAEHMEYLADNGFEVWSLPRLAAALKARKSLPEKVIAITFDDGYESVYSQARPILRAHGFPFTVFINSRRVAGSGFMDWKQLGELASENATIGNHTASHPHLVRLSEGESEEAWRQRVRREMIEVEKVIESRIGHSAGLLAYPYGEYNRATEAIAADLGLVAFAQNSGAFDADVNWQAVPRFAFGGAYADMPGFIDKVNSLAMPLTEAFASVRQGRRLDDPLLPGNDTRPRLTLKLESASLASRVNCFASGQGRIDVRVNGKTVTTRPSKPVPVGRSRINCTAPSDQQGRFYWYSHFFMRKNEDGSWYQEP